MRTRWIAACGSLVWAGFVMVVAVVGDIDWSIALLFVGLGLLGVAVLAVALTTNRLAAQARPVRAPRAKALSGAEVQRIAKAVRADNKATFRQLEALQNLYAMLPIQHALPASRGFPASPDLLLFLVDLVDRHRSKVIVECGSGLSTLCFALALRQFGIDGRVIALEHLEEYAEQTRELLARHGVSDIAEVRVAPLEVQAVGDTELKWYAPQAWSDITDVDLFLIDGPPATGGPLARYPAMPLFLDKLSVGAQVVLDDFARSEEQAILTRWEAEHPGRLDVARVPLEKGAALVTLR